MTRAAPPAAPRPMPAFAPVESPISAAGCGVGVGVDVESVVPVCCEPVAVAEVVLLVVVCAAMDVGLKSLVHMMEPPAVLGRLANAGIMELPTNKGVDEQYGSQFAAGSRSRSVEFSVKVVHPPHKVSPSVSTLQCWMATHSCSAKKRDFQGQALALKPISVQPAMYVLPADHHRRSAGWTTSWRE